MAPKIFMTGVTGYIGGDALHVLSKAHPDWELTCLVRNSSKGAKVASQYPAVRLVYGDLDSAALITQEVKKADIVYNFANCDHEVAAKAIAAGFSQREGETPAFWIHTSGSMILAWETLQKKCLGELLPKVYNDWDGVGELVSLPDFAAHRVVDKMVLACPTTTPRVKIAIVCPPTIYGPGRGPDNQRSMQAYEAARCVLERKQGFLPCAGKSIWHQVHVQDLSDLYLSLGEAAAEGGGKATWNQEGYYLAENGAFAWGDVFKSITAIAMKKGLIEKEGTPEEPPEELEKLTRAGHRMWATNSRGESLRGRNLLGWKPYRRSLLEELPDIVEGEARSLGLIQGHAAKVTQ